MYHDIYTTLTNPASVAVEDGMLRIAAGAWPALGGPIAVAASEQQLSPDSRYVYLAWTGTVVVSDEPLLYGQGPTGQRQDMADLLAWEQGGWQVKRLVPAI